MKKIDLLQITEVTSKYCEFFKKQLEYNLEHHVFQSFNPIYERMIHRSDELTDVFAEISTLLKDETQWKFFLDFLVDMAKYGSEEEIAVIREDFNELEPLNTEIYHLSSLLAKKLKRRNDILEGSRLDCEFSFDLVDLIHLAGEHNGHYQLYTKSELTTLRSKYGLKYWPSLPDFIEAIAIDNENLEVTPKDEGIRSILDSSRPSLSDYFRNFFSELEDCRTYNGGNIPSLFRISDGALASIANVTLDLHPEDFVDATYVKSLRQRLRKSGMEFVW